MPALITHHLFGEESIDRLPQALLRPTRSASPLSWETKVPTRFSSTCSRRAFRLYVACSGHAPLAHVAPSSPCLRDGVSHLQPRDANLGRAFALGLLSHYVLDRNAHPLSTSSSLALLSPTPSSRLRAVKFTPCSKATWTC